MARIVKILAIHGIGHQEAKLDEWVDDWKHIVAQGLISAAAETGAEPVIPEFDFFYFDQKFEKSAYPVSGRAYCEALRQLGTALLLREMPDSGPGTRGIFDSFTHGFRWTVGMVAQWVAYSRLRQELNLALANKIRASKPDVLLAHSLGTLISYDTLAQSTTDLEVNRLLFVTCGSQIGHPAVAGSVFGGRIRMPAVGHWFHLFNPEDQVFTAEIRLSDPNFQQIDTPFDVPLDVTNHSAMEYLGHTSSSRVWESVVTEGASEQTHRTMRGLFTQTRKNGAMYRALIIGIDQYANPQANLEGCANDAYLMSATLQDLHFPVEQIRLVLNERATAHAIRDRLQWLLDDVQPGDVRFLHYSGHGAQIPSYGPNAEVDQYDECLVPHDFDWSPTRAILDDWFYQHYSQLPYDARFIAVLDCCHSGGLTRSGGVRVRGLNPPDDIRHRAMEFSDDAWQPRVLPRMETAVSSRKSLQQQLTGVEGTNHCLCGALTLRTAQTTADYHSCQRSYQHLGPYLPVLLQACAEFELAEEVRMGATAHGAFTYHISKALRKLRNTGKRFSYKRLVAETKSTMARAGINQVPQLVGPTAILNRPVPTNDRPPKPTNPPPKPARRVARRGKANRDR